jgi:hypothetical protein
MRKTAIRSILMASIVALLITGITAAQEIGAVYDPEPNIDGYFEHTINDWKFIGDAMNERVHVIGAVYGEGTTNDLRLHLETEFGLNTQSN